MKIRKLLAILLAVSVMAAALAFVSGCTKTEEVESVEPAYLFDKGVWSASVDGEIDTYFIFYDQQSGRTERADGTGGVGFTCEQEGTTATFHFGSADDVTKATFNMGDNTGTFEYGENTVVYYFELVSGADADNFEIPPQG